MKLINTYTGSYPVVFHAPGSSRKHQFWLEMVEHVDHLQPVEFYEDFEVITWSSYDYPTLIEKCMEKLGVPVTVLKPTGAWNNLMKISTLIEYLPKSKAKYIIGLDADDVIVTDSPDKIIQRWRELYPESKLLYNGGYQRWPKRYCQPCRPCDEFEQRQFSGARAKHLNAGAWVGEREYVLEFYKQVQAVEREKLFHTMYRFMEQPSIRCTAYPANYPEIMVDSNSTIFQHMLLGVTDCKYTHDYNLPEGKRLIYYDLGAFDGRTTYNFIMAHRPHRAYAFEPAAAHLETDYWRTLRSRYSKVCDCSNYAVWTTECDLEFFIDKTNARSQSCTAVKEKHTVDNIDKEHPVMVQAIDFNAWFKGRHRKNDFTVVKMDIEGAEYDVLGKMMDQDTLKDVDELRVEYHGSKMDGVYDHIEESVADYCTANDVNLLVMDH